MIPASVQAAVRERAGRRCEYCRLPQTAVELKFHVEHIIAIQHGGPDSPDNLALACHRRNLVKGPNLSSLDPETGQLVALFHPRRQRWGDHFELRGEEIIGKTDIGRTTVF